MSWIKIDDICAPFDWTKVFSQPAPIEIDLGAGDGNFVVASAQQYPGRNFLAVERLMGRATKIVKKAQRLHLTNLKVLRLESAYTVKYLIPPCSVDRIHLMFPDPWPKRKHLSRRIVQPDFIDSIVHALVTGGEFRFTTDHHEYFHQASPIISTHPHLQTLPLWDLLGYPQTDFEKGFLAEGKSIYRQRWQKNLVNNAVFLKENF